MATKQILGTLAALSFLLLLLPTGANSGAPIVWPITKVVFSNQNEGWIVGSHRLLRTIDGGRTWIDLTEHFEASAETNPLFGKPFLVDLRVGERGEVWLSLVNQLYLSQDGGDTLHLALRSADIHDYCHGYGCEMQQISGIDPGSVSVLTTRYPIIPNSRFRRYDRGNAETAVLTLPRSARASDRLSGAAVVTSMPRHTRKIVLDSNNEMLALKGDGIFRLTEAGWVEVYRPASHIEDFALTGSKLWIADGNRLIRLDTSTGLLDESRFEGLSAIDALLMAEERRAVFHASEVGMSSGLRVRRNRILCWDSRLQQVVSSLRLGTMEARGFFLDDQEGWLAIGPPASSPAAEAYSVLHSVDGGATWVLIFTDESFPEELLNQILGQDMVRDMRQEPR